MKLLAALGLSGLAIFVLNSIALRTMGLSAGHMPIWPGDGIVLALMLGPFRRHRVSALCAGQASALAAEVCAGYPLSMTAPFNLVAAIFIAGVYLVTKQSLGGQRLTQSTAFLKFLVVATTGSVLPATALAITYSHMYHLHPLGIFLSCVASKSVGCAVLTPVILMFTARRGLESSRPKVLWRDFIMLSLYCCVAAGVFLQQQFPLLFVIPLGLMAVAYTSSLASMAVAVLVTAILAVAATLVGHGPISLMHEGAGAQLSMLQAFLVIITGTSLPIAALMDEHGRLKDSLIAARIEAESANQAKSQFLATISHEIRTPLNGVLGMAQVIAMHELSSSQRERLGVIRASGDTLLSILNDVLDLSKIESGALTLETIEFDLCAMCRSAVQSYESLAHEKGLTISLVTGGADGVYRGDPTRLRQILVNLISNAVKFSTVGTIEVEVQREGGAVRLSVTDKGIGIPADKLPKLFTKFTQADASTTRKYGGAGLGLSICRELTTLMGGSISAESRDGEGSRFTAVLPLAWVAAAPASVPVSEGAVNLAPADENFRILAAEDNATNQLVLQTLLQTVGLKITLVENGEQAVEAWARQPWDLILMDVQMPIMDGPAATRIIRTRERDEGRPRTPIIALTANTMAHQLTTYLAAGMDAHLAKPIEAGALFAAVSAVMAGEPALAEAVAAA